MQLDIMTMDTRVARMNYIAYQKAVRAHREERRLQAERDGKKAASELATAGSSEAGRELHRIRIAKSRLEREDEELMRAYREMSLGARLINLTTVMLKAGTFEDSKLPKLAIAQASWKDCFFVAGQQDNACFFRETTNGWEAKKKSQTIYVPRAAFSAEVWNTAWRSDQRREGKRAIMDYPVKAIVPSIPVHLRPAGDLSDYHILWEAVWTKAPPVDPLLLKHIGGQTYSVLAQWDLTPIERSILTGRLS